MVDVINKNDLLKSDYFTECLYALSILKVIRVSHC